MTELQKALSALKKTPFSDVPADNLPSYLHNTFVHAELIVNSVPPPPGGEDFPPAHRTRSDLPPASKASEMTASSVRPPQPSKAHADLQKAWGKPLKLGAKDNPLGVSVFKMAGHDRHGAWFARRSIHEGLGFKKWKEAMQSEFPESLAVHKGPGEGSVRGIGGDRVLERKEVKGVGKLEVLELSAKFPAPTSPRDFVTLLLTTDSGLGSESSFYPNPAGSGRMCPRSWTVVSIPVDHPDAPPRDGLVRGQYESVEMIREIPLPQDRKESGASLDSSQGTADDTESELNPVEWIMVTRSDPGGGIPRFLVDRGTPPSIAADTVKFLDWACARSDRHDSEVINDGADDHVHHDSRRPSYTSFHQSFTAGINKDLDRPMVVSQQRNFIEEPEDAPKGLLASITDSVGQTIAANTPDVIRQNLPGLSPGKVNDSDKDSIATSSSSGGSFASAEPYFTAETGETMHDTSSTPTSSVIALGKLNDVNESQKSIDSRTSLETAKGLNGQHTHHNRRELVKIELKKDYLDKKLAAAREKQDKAVQQAAQKSGDDINSVRERHEHDIKKQEERHAKEMAKLEERQRKEMRKIEARERKEEAKNRLLMSQRECDDWRLKAEGLEKENAVLRERVGELQRENTLMVVKLGKAGETGHDLLKSVMEESKISRARASSVGSRGSHKSEDSSARKRILEKVEHAVP